MTQHAELFQKMNTAMSKINSLESVFENDRVEALFLLRDAKELFQQALTLGDWPIAHEGMSACEYLMALNDFENGLYLQAIERSESALKHPEALIKYHTENKSPLEEVSEWEVQKASYHLMLAQSYDNLKDEKNGQKYARLVKKTCKKIMDRFPHGHPIHMMAEEGLRALRHNLQKYL
jgi:tetratricopeptide (TPR) repeat protein